jgi:exonuclease SbcC
MHLHRLEFLGLGPFRDRQVIDFSDLTTSGLFLLDGPTGSGKSTIIDAIVFALYGDVAAAAADKGRLVSHFLPAGQDPYAELVFETNAGTFRVRRTPRHDVPKADGSGTTTRNARISLIRLATPEDQSGEVLSTRIEEAGAEITRILGLTKDQFVGTIVLPQGEFAAFLRAEGSARRPILQRIFRTEAYERLQDRLWEAKREAEGRRADAHRAVAVGLGAFHGAAGTTADDPTWSQVAESDTPALLDALATSLADLEERAGAAERAAAAAAGRRDSVQAELTALERRIAVRDRLRAALARQEALVGVATEHAGRVLRLAAAERAERVADTVAAAARASQHAAVAVADAAAARAALPADARPAGLTELEQARAEAHEEQVSLRPMIVLEEGLATRAAELASSEAELVEVTASVAAARAGLLEVPDRLRELADRRAHALTEQAQVPALAAEAERCAGRHAAAQALAAAEVAQSAADAAAREALAAVDAADAKAAALRGQYRDGLAAELGAQLQDDVPCPVCGALEHPAPARPGSGHVTRAEVDAAEDLVRQLRREADQQREALGECIRDCERLSSAAAGMTSGAAADALAEASRRLEAAQAAASDLAGIDEQIRELETVRSGFEEQESTGRERAASLGADLQRRTRQLADDRGVVDGARAGYPTVTQRADALSGLVSLLDAAVATERSHADAAGREAEANRALAAALAREGFADVTEAISAAVPPDERADLAERIAAHEREVAQVEGLLADPELNGVDLAEEFDTATVEARLATAQGDSDWTADERGRAEGQLAAGVARATEVRTAVAERDAIVAGTAALITVATLARGNNRLSMDLATYVLQRRFESVVAAANEHLRVMSDGQLQLVATDESEGRARRAGLGLRVIDLRTDRDRSPGTLSGGETFFTALSLALGLAAVVTGEAGGVDLGTLFVDEGFGSLDSETLDDVLGVLTSLHASGGRTVGVVSHVEEMKSRIPERIEVRREGQHGSSRLTVIA